MKTARVLLISSFTLVALSYVSGHGYIWGGLAETYFRGWKNSNIDDIEFRDLRTISAANSASPWMAKNEGNLAFTEEERAWHEEYLSLCASRVPASYRAVSLTKSPDPNWPLRRGSSCGLASVASTMECD